MNKISHFPTGFPAHFTPVRRAQKSIVWGKTFLTPLHPDNSLLLQDSISNTGKRMFSGPLKGKGKKVDSWNVVIEGTIKDFHLQLKQTLSVIRLLYTDPLWGLPHVISVTEPKTVFKPRLFPHTLSSESYQSIYHLLMMHALSAAYLPLKGKYVN